MTILRRGQIRRMGLSYQVRVYTVYMPKRLSIQPHLTLDVLERRYRAAKDPVARSHWQILWLLAQGKPAAQVAAVTGYTANWVRSLAQRYSRDGPAGLGDHRHQNPGSPGLLSVAQLRALARALDQPPADGGLWTGPKVAAWMAATLGRPVHPQRAGRCSSGSACAPKCPGHAMPRPTPLPRPPLKKAAAGSPHATGGLPRGYCRVVDD
jgi:Winged helix-turn helix